MKQLFKFGVKRLIVTGWLNFDLADRSKWDFSIGVGKYDNQYDINLLLISLMLEVKR